MASEFINYEVAKRFIKNSEKVMHKMVFEYAGLSDKEANILFDRFVDDKTQKEVAEKLGITTSRVSQIEHMALNKLYNTLRICAYATEYSGLGTMNKEQNVITPSFMNGELSGPEELIIESSVARARVAQILQKINAGESDALKGN